MRNKIAFLLIFVLFLSFFGSMHPAEAGSLVWRSLPAASDKIDPALAESLKALQSGEMVTVIVTLPQQADLSRVRGADRAARQQGVILALQATANATQNQLTRLLDARKRQGLVQNYESLWVFNGLSITATGGVINELAQRPDVLSIAPDNIDIVPVLGPAESNLAVVSAPALWNMGYTGQGIVVADMDSGVDISHPDLASRWRGGTNSWYDPYNQHPNTPYDKSGHGTWTTGIMVGGDAGGTTVGVAPGAQWIAVKIFDDRGKSTATAIHQGFQWLLDPDHNPATADAPNVVNNSWTYGSPGCNLSFEPDMQALRAAGILPVFAAGNGGPGSNTSYSPANNPSAFAVGATDNNDQVYTYSSRGPSTCGGSTGPFPELVAPGVNIRTTGLFGTYYSDSGTSFAAPHVAGGLALLLAVYPNLSADDQAQALINSAVDLGASGPDDVFGYGRLNLFAAFNWLQTAPTSTPPPPTATPTAIPTNTPTPPASVTMHVGDMDGSSAKSGSKWSAIVTILVHDANENPLANVTVSGNWTNGANGTASCTTNASGVCSVTKTGINSKTASITFTITNLTQAGSSYVSSANQDPDGDSNGTTIIVSKP